MSTKRMFKTIDEYLECQTKDTKETLLALRAIIKKAIPDATELLNYNMLAFALVAGGKRDKQIMVAGYKTFVGFYTGNGILEHFSKELAGYRVGKASVQFPSNQPLPEDLIAEIIGFKKSLLADSPKL